MDNRNIIFIIPNANKSYENVGIKSGAFHLPSLAVSILIAIAKENNYNPAVLDLTFYENDEEVLSRRLSELKPELVGITCTSATYFHALEVARLIKSKLPETKILIGGPHVSSSIQDTLKNDCFDYIFIGESEKSFRQFLKGVNPKEIEGIAFKGNEGSIHSLQNRSYIQDFNEVPYPDYSLYDFSLYRLSRLHTPKNPTVFIETSRGCPFGCKICNKIVHGYKFRAKSSERVLSEIEHLIKTIGLNNFFISDDGFTTDIKRAEEICDGIINKKLNVSWSCPNGIRPDSVNQTLVQKMRKAGCYRVGLGIESGNQKVLDNLGKKTTLEKVEAGVRMIKKAGIETLGFFIVGFPDDTEKTMQETINFAHKLPLDYAKVSIAMPFPGTVLHDEYSAKNLVYPPGDFRMYNFHLPPKKVYKHPVLSWDLIEKYYKKFYRSFYYDIKFIFRRFIGSIRNRNFFDTAKVALSIAWHQRK